MDTRPGHEYQAPTASDSRSPCPALNAAANHGYLPHDGKNLSLLQLMRMLNELYNITYPLGFVLSMGGILLCGNKLTLSVDLAQLDKHNRVEHDASIVHQDQREGDWVHPDRLLLEELVAQSADGKGLTFEDFAKARARREARPGVKIDKIHTGIARGEAVLAFMIVGNGNELAVERIREWFGDEKLPKGWMPNGNMGLIELDGLNRKFARMCEAASEELRSQ